MPRWNTSAIAILVIILAAGCGGSGLEKVIVRGEVTYLGEPVMNGDILFYPIEGTEGPVSGASIKDGGYITTGKGGVPVGQHRVQIRGFQVGSQQREIPGGEMAGLESSTRRQYLPAKFNDQSELTVEVPGGSGEVTHDFHLVD